jgi:hypothetical protein
MGLTRLAAEFLVQARSQGVEFGDSLTLGRQVMFISPVDAAKLLRRYKLFPEGLSEEEFYRQQFSSPYVADAFLRALGAKEVTAMDFTDYEGPVISHDLNQPVRDELKDRFDTVIDGGTLEHVFNFPTAIQNCMEMVKVGGTLFIVTPANNHFGHGFYQFSAELFYRVFTPANGFEVQRIHAAENEVFGTSIGRRLIPVEYPGRAYSVSDPDQLRRRVILATKRPVYMLVQAKRIERKPIFETSPQQSDYAAAWDLQSSHKAVTFNPKWAKLKHIQLHWLPALCRLNPFFFWNQVRKRSLGNRENFKKV